MASITIKNIPEDLHERLREAAGLSFRSLNNEVLARVQFTFDLEDAAATKQHQAWIDEGLQSGPAKPEAPGQRRAALRRALARARQERA